MKQAGTTSLFLPLGNVIFFFLPCITRRMHLTFFVSWTMTTLLTTFLKTKSRKLPPDTLVDKLRTQDFAGSLSSRASRVLGPISRHRIADILLHLKLVSGASRLGLLIGFFRTLSHGLCTVGRFHTAENYHSCRIGCLDESDSLTHFNLRPRLHKIFISFWRHATILPPRNCLLHDVQISFFSQ